MIENNLLVRKIEPKATVDYAQSNDDAPKPDVSV